MEKMKDSQSGLSAWKTICVVSGIILFVIGLLLLFAPILLVDTAEENFITEISVWLSIIIIAVGCILNYLGLKLELSNSDFDTCYIDENGNLDLSTPRKYEAKKVTVATHFMGSPFVGRGGRSIIEFIYDGGIVYIKTQNGKELRAPLSDLEVIVVNRLKGMDSAAITLKHRDQKLKILQNSLYFGDLANEDMLQILSYAGMVRETKMSKINNWLNYLRDILHLSTGDIIEGFGSDDSVRMNNEELLEKMRESSFESSRDKDEGKSKKESGEEKEEDDEEYDLKNRTPAQVAADDEIERIVNAETLSDTLPDLRKLAGESSAYGREKLLTFYEEIISSEPSKDETEERKSLKTHLKDSVLLKDLYPIEQIESFVKAIKEEASTLTLFKGFLISVIVSCVVWKIDGLGWWNLLISVGIIIAGMIMTAKWSGNAIGTKVQEVKDYLQVSREEILNTYDKGVSPTLSYDPEFDLDSLKAQLRNLKKSCWIWGAAVAIAMGLALLIPFGKNESVESVEVVKLEELDKVEENETVTEDIPEFKFDPEVRRAIKDLYSIYYSPIVMEDVKPGGDYRYTYTPRLREIYKALEIKEGIEEPFTTDLRNKIEEFENLSNKLGGIVCSLMGYDYDILYCTQDCNHEFSLDLLKVGKTNSDEILLYTNFSRDEGDRRDTIPRVYLMKLDDGHYRINNIVDIYEDGESWNYREDMKSESIEYNKMMNSIKESVKKLPIPANDDNEYPDYKFGSHEKWENFKSSIGGSSGKFTNLQASGVISHGGVVLDCIVTNQGQIIGRYWNLSNDIKLDVNGYISSEGNLFIRLGHGSELSEWSLSPSGYYHDSENGFESFLYEGEWGKKGLPSYLVIHL